jgi:hypothetical protein
VYTINCNPRLSLITCRGGDSTATIAESGPTYTSTQNNNTQSSSPIGIIVGVVVTAVVASLLAAAWYLWHRRKTRLQSEKTGRTDLNGSTSQGTKRMPVVAGTTADPRVIEPFYTAVPNPGKGHPNETFISNPQNQQQYPELSSGYYSQATPPSTSSPAPSGYSPPSNQTQFAPLHLQAPSTTSGTAYTASTAPDSRATPWATSILGETSNQARQRPVADTSISKARYSGANSLGASSTSRPLSPPAIDDSVPPPQYEL